jgi:alginate O-acetyltransferase complex protein AlgI
VIFTTVWFLLFSLGVLLLLGLFPWPHSWRLLFVLCAAVIFYYHYAGIFGLLFIVGIAALVYLGGFVLSRGNSPRLALVLFLMIPLASLLYFKYTAFLGSSLIDAARINTGLILLRPIGDWLIQHKPTIIPLGISFFVFEFCHYLVDVSKGDKPIKKLIHFLTFALFYPRLAAGPIVRYQQILPQLENLQGPTQKDYLEGAFRLVIGFLKKFMLADPVATLIERAYPSQNVLVGQDVVVLSVLLYIRIYMDFSGYSDMAIGLGRFLGIQLPENFRFPFLATSPSDFWRRWHISLSTWIRDYIYIPLGGNRVPAWQKPINSLIAMGLCGLWHGAAWNFFFWGILHGIYLLGGNIARKILIPADLYFRDRQGVGRIYGGSKVLLGGVITQGLVCFSWIIFFYPLDQALVITRKLLVW